MYTDLYLNKTLRRWELVILIIFAFISVVGLWLNREQSALSEKVIRLHVIANSDSAEDQALKLQVRDAIMSESEGWFVDCGDAQSARTALEGRLDELSDVASQVVAEKGYSYPVTVSLEDNVWFPTRSYDDFSLPAGNYTALRLVIGEGEGKNWWCVVFPPLCLGAVSETVEDTASSAGLDSSDVSLITGDSEGYIIKFKAIELWEEFKAAL
ncbi:hypothetical protein SDC9_55398 [bioreactor metagenome]|uniref:Stage II sporulation protein R n=1 Tax=bioreactor metagenome TaxID=1076179 RepID=A0A644WZ23_9ZZZZ